MKVAAARSVTMLVAVALLATMVTSGCAFRSPSEPTVSTADVRAATPNAASPDGPAGSKTMSFGAAGSAPAPASGSAESVAAPAADRLVISNAGMMLEVKNLDQSVQDVRALAAKYGATIADLSTNAGSEPLPTPQPVDGTVQQSAPTPGGATITLRVPANNLAAAEKDAAALGRVISQTASENDVTQQHVDLAARLKNLQAEEARLRSFFRQAKSVSEMLAIERQLSRVRGEIESMQAQIAYLENQAALATFTIQLSEPGALVSPASGGWGFAAAFRDGVRAAAALIRGLIVLVFPLAVLLALGLLVWWAIRAIVHSSRRRRDASHGAPAERGNEPPTSE